MADLDFIYKLLDDLKTEIEDLNEVSEECDSLNEKLAEYGNEFDENKLLVESSLEDAFNAGYDSCSNGDDKLRGLLNYKIEARL